MITYDYSKKQPTILTKLKKIFIRSKRNTFVKWIICDINKTTIFTVDTK